MKLFTGNKALVMPMLLSVSLLPALVHGEEGERQRLPLYEYGVLGLAASLPHYRGAGEYSHYAFPLPYFVYRGEVVQANRDGVRSIFWRYGRLQTDLSLAGNPPVPDDNEAREGMPALDAIVEIGPALRFYLWEYGERDALYLQFNTRAAIAVGWGDGPEMAGQGALADLKAVFRDSRSLQQLGLRYHFDLAAQFADSSYHEYFYEVEQQYATEQRPAYAAGGGYSGLSLSASLVKELTPSLTLSCYGRWINISGAVYADSPLVDEENNYVAGVMVSWVIGASSRLESTANSIPAR